MPIKKSYLEQKWYYRVAKVFFLILPLLVILFFLNGKINICDISQKNILDILQKNIVYIAAGLVSYYLILKAIWRLFLYIVFGGLEDDTKKAGSQAIQPVNPDAQPVRPRPAGIAQWIPIIIILSVVAIYVLSEMGYVILPKIDLNSLGSSNVKTTSKSTCFATSAQWGTPCRSVENGVGVSGVIVPASCNCPNDTTYAQMDNITAGGPYRICTCK